MDFALYVAGLAYGSLIALLLGEIVPRVIYAGREYR